MSWAPAEVRAQIAALRAKGASFHRIAAELNRNGLNTVQGGRWYGATVHRVVASANNERKPG